MGQLYKRGTRWWIKYYVNGRPVRESTKTTKETEARRILKEREGRVATGQPILPRADRIKYEEAAEDLRRHYRTTGKRDLQEAEYRLKHLDGFFKGKRLASIGPADITAYIELRQDEGAKNGTINCELATLSKLLKLAYENNKLVRPPVIHKIKKPDPRQGFFEEEEFLRVRRLLPPDLQLAMSIAYVYGWRIKKEILTLEWRQVDLRAGTMRLEPGMTKNDKARVVYLTPELHDMLSTQLAQTFQLGAQMNRIIPYVFPHLSSPHRGERIKDFKKLWKRVCRDAGCPGMYRHDCRRTAVRNGVNAGIKERVMMEISGHKTRHVFDDYHIVPPADLQDAAKKLAGIVSGIVDPKTEHAHE